MTRPNPFAISALCLALAAPALAQAQARDAQASGAAAAGPARPVAFDARAAEHLWNRAGFGALPDEIRRSVAQGNEATVDRLLADAELPPAPYFAEKLSQRDGMRPGEVGTAARDKGLSPGEMEPDDLKREVARMRAKDRLQLADYASWWVERMLAGETPLVERMTLFWHGHFTSSFDDVKSSYEMIQQNRLFRRHALGSFRELLHAIARDPAMLEYLDNASNKKGAPNENFARELLELFTLGEGHYTEQDVLEIARAFTGWTDRSGNFRFAKQQHDFGPKTAFGQTGRFDGDQVIDLVLAQPACAEHLAAKLITWFEGLPPDPARNAEYAAVLRGADYAIAPFLRKLFLDPRFYRADAIGTRVTSPIDYLVGSARRLEAGAPPLLVGFGARLLGQQLFFPPSVKGWDGGESWITTQTFMQRGNLAGMMLGVVSAADIVRPDAPELAAEPAPENMESGMEPAPVMDAGADAPPSGRPLAATSADADKKAKKRLGGRDNPMQILDRLEGLGWRSRVHLSARVAAAGAKTDAAVVDLLADELLPGALEPETRAHLVRVLGEERARAGIAEDALAAGDGPGEHALRTLAHILLSLPEAQLD